MLFQEVDDGRAVLIGCRMVCVRGFFRGRALASGRWRFRDLKRDNSSAYIHRSSLLSQPSLRRFQRFYTMVLCTIVRSIFSCFTCLAGTGEPSKNRPHEISTSLGPNKTLQRSLV